MEYALSRRTVGENTSKGGIQRHKHLWIKLYNKKLDNWFLPMYNTDMAQKNAKQIFLIARVTRAERSVFIRLAGRARVSLGEWLRRAAREKAEREKRAA